MKIIDTHCDALFKLQRAAKEKGNGMKKLRFQDADQIETNVVRLKQGKVSVQFFAIFIYPDVPSHQIWQHALEQIDFFYDGVFGKNQAMKQMTSWSDLDDLQDGEIGAVLTLEGADAFGNDVVKLRHLYRVGVMSVGLTWNIVNLCAVGECGPHGGRMILVGNVGVQ